MELGASPPPRGRPRSSGQHLVALPFPAANSTPWQLEGTILAAAARLRIRCDRRTRRSSPMPSRVASSASRSSSYDIPVLYNRGRGREVVQHRPKADAAASTGSFGGHPDPRLFLRQEHRPPADDEYITTTTGAMKNAFGNLLNTRRHYTSWIHETLVDLLAIRRIHQAVCDHGRHSGRQRARARCIRS